VLPLPSGSRVTSLLDPPNEGDPNPGGNGNQGTDWAVGLHWIPLQNGLVLGPIETRTPRPGTGDIYTADTDGFFIGYLGTHNGGGDGTLQVTVTHTEADGQAVTSRRFGCTSVHRRGNGDNSSDVWISHNSVTVPVSAGDTYRPVYTPRWNNDNALRATFCWVPVLHKKM
jgi:hypothetical protein